MAVAAATGSETRSTVEHRAGIALTLLALFVGFIAFFVIAAEHPPLPMLGVVRAGLFASAVTIVAVYLIEARGLAILAPWAVAAVRPVLGIAILLDLANLVVDLGRGRFDIPVVTILAVWALRGRPSGAAADLGTRGRTLIGAMLVASVAGAVAVPALGPGGALDVGQGDLTQSIVVDCTPVGPQPATVTAMYRWSWARQRVFPDGEDAAVIRFFSRDDNGAPLYIATTTSASAPGIEDGAAGMSGDMAQQFAQEWAGSSTWTVLLGEQRYAPGEVRLTLLRTSRDPVKHGTLEVDGLYVHLGQWRSLEMDTSCSW